MDVNPYESPIETCNGSNHSEPRLLYALTGFLFGGLCGASGGVVGGALGGLTYRLAHDVSEGVGVFGLFESIDTPADFAIFRGTLVASLLTLFGCVLGAICGVRLPRHHLGVRAIIVFSVAGLLIGFFSGATLTTEKYFIRRFVEGPVTSALTGCVAASIAWTAFSNRMNNVASDATKCSKLLLFTASIIAAVTLSFCAVIVFFEKGTNVLQVGCRFGAIVAIGFLAILLWKQRRLLFKAAV